MPSTLVTFNPAPEVKLDGSVPAGFADLLFAATVEESVAGLARCEIRVDNWGVTPDGLGYLFVDRSAVDYGMTVDVAFGPPDERATVFSGRLTGIEGDFSADSGPTLVLLAEDALQDMRMTRRTRTFENSSDADVVTRIANDHGLGADVDLDGPSHSALCQFNQSDLSFLRDRALPYGADVWLDGKTLHVGRRDDDPLALRHGRELLSFRVLADLAMQATEQRVAGWDPESKEEVFESADQSSLGADLGADVGGGRLLADAFGDRVATATLPGTVTTAEAKAWASGLYRERARRFVTGTGVADGLAGMRAGRSVTVSGLGGLFDGTYRLSRVVHRYDLAAGYRTEFDVERAGIERVNGGILEAVRPRADAMSGAAGGWAGVHVALVTDNQDPLGQGRVKVKLPWSPDSGSDRYETWARVATLMAGADRGTWFIPDVDDEVIVAFDGGDPRRPVVLGALWNGSDQPPEQMAANNPKRTILTGAGVRITLDDSQGAVSLLLETPGGQRVRLDDTPATVTVEDASGNSATLESSGVTVVAAGDLNLRAGGHVSVNASMVQVSAGMSTFSGVVQADTVITNSIVAASYMPGAGNLL